MRLRRIVHESKPGNAPDKAKTTWKNTLLCTNKKKEIHSDQIRKRQMATWTDEEDSEIRSHKEVH